MERAFYLPPPGHPPFEFVLSGNGRVFMPPDQYWKKISQEYEVGVIMHEKTGMPRLDPKTGRPLTLKQFKKVWVPDEARNQRVKEKKEMPPQNWLDLGENELRYLGRAEFQPFTQYLKRESNELRTNRSTYAEIQRQGQLAIQELEDRIKNAKAKLEAQAVDVEAEVEKMLKLQAAVKSGEATLADALPQKPAPTPVQTVAAASPGDAAPAPKPSARR